MISPTRFRMYTFRGNQYLGDLPLQSANGAVTMNDAGAFSARLYPATLFGLPNRSSYASTSDALVKQLGESVVWQRLAYAKTASSPWFVKVIPETSNRPQGTWVLTGRQWNSEQSGQAPYWSLTGIELAGYLKQRAFRGATGGEGEAINAGMPAGLSTGIDQVTGTLKGLVDYAQSSRGGVGNIGIDTSQLQPSGVMNQESYDPNQRETLFQLMQNLASTIGGPDWWVTTEWLPGTKTPHHTLVAGYPKLGRRWTENPDTIPTLVFPGNILSWTETEDGTECASVCDALSHDSTGGTTIQTAYNANLERNGLPQLDYVDQRDGGEEAAVNDATLLGYAQGDAAVRNGPQKIGDFTVSAAALAGFIFPGDEVRLRLRDWNYPMGIDEYQRMLGWSIDFDKGTAKPQIATASGTPVVA